MLIFGVNLWHSCQVANDHLIMPDEKTPTSLDKINELVLMSTLTNVINVKCGPKTVIPSLDSHLIKVSGFFESMIELNKTKSVIESRNLIDISEYCVHVETLVTLIQFANTCNDFQFPWRMKSTVNLLLLSDVFKLTPIVNDRILFNVFHIFNKCDNSELSHPLLERFIQHCFLSFTTKNTNSFEIEMILKLLGSRITFGDKSGNECDNKDEDQVEGSEGESSEDSENESSDDSEGESVEDEECKGSPNKGILLDNFVH